MGLVNAPHQRQFLGAGARRLVVQPCAADSEQLALSSERNLFMDLSHGSTLLQRGRASPRAKKLAFDRELPGFLEQFLLALRTARWLPWLLENRGLARSPSSAFCKPKLASVVNP